MVNAALPPDWAYSPALDAELKEYRLLAYLQAITGRFAERKLYPYLQDLDARLMELLRLRREKQALRRALGGELTGFDPATGQAVHTPPPQDPWLDVVDEVIAMAIPRLRHALAEGMALRGDVVQAIRFSPVGLLPLNPQAGWLLLRMGGDARAYLFELPMVSPAPGPKPPPAVRTRYVTSFAVGIATTYERIKGELLRHHRELPNPAVFAFETDLPLPRIETYMPVAKQLLFEALRPAA
ncbi:MAG: hypothetical protein QY325_14140 [Flavobacteriales bacterium]|nr:MAG: hypothetical protein QY325_14140 [Flavobacteriales bacterium]